MKISLRAARVNANLTAAAAGAMIGRSRFAIANWENGTSLIPAVDFVELCRIYGAKAEDIFLPRKSTESRKSEEVKHGTVD